MRLIEADELRQISEILMNRVLVQIMDERRADLAGRPDSSGSQDSCPDFGRGLLLRCQSTQIELFLANTMHELDATHCRGGASEPFQAK